MTEQFNIGTFAFSKAGHDKKHIYVIVGTDASYVYLADGILKTTSQPKKKNRKHIQWTHMMDGQIQDILNQGKTMSDEDIKNAIATYKATVS